MLLAYHQENTIEAGCDEAGRGCLAGPVVAAAAIMPVDFSHAVLNDSKQLSAKKREALVDVIKDAAIAWGIGVVDNVEIDEINILNASFLAMHRAIDQLSVRPELLLIDGNRFNRYRDIPHETMIKGDGRFYSIAAASVLAKTHRDDLMTQYALQYPQYGWDRNAGYPTKAHRAAIKEFGSTPLHRQSFRLLPEQLEIFD
ncbi:ribonuclease HII [Reichenbachiella sp. 5M10]|uniref:ribonuclease HII n=1 Tax=Reichenbachiella sp. 5M10 TaxID=1889772 RepID=UPI000C158146|nr:ribonuclease HII [Reichenbachiella sp. 5M10]PIB36086.1 ribonuclease HII [Reichenbachiella sp. 5M10]